MIDEKKFRPPNRIVQAASTHEDTTVRHMPLIDRRSLISLAAGASLSLCAPYLLAAEPIAVIVNPQNKENPSRADLSAIFTTRKQAWDGGARIIPLNFPAKHPLRIAFDEAILRMDANDIARYWIDRRIRGGNAPPKQIPSAQLVMRLVAKLEGAVGYIPESVVNSSVRVVAEI